MSAVLLKSFAAPPLDTREIFRYARCAAPGEAEEALLAQVRAEAEEKLTYRVCWRELDVCRSGELCTLGGVSVESQSLASALSGCGKAIVFAATIGLELDRLLVKYNRISSAKALFLQALGAERVEALCDAFCAEFARAKPRFSPGYGDLPLAFQREVFALLDCERKLGLTLNESLLMSPSKSVTAIMGLMPEGETL